MKSETFETGAVREDQGTKTMFGLISPVAMRLLAEHMTKGAEKYEPRNWEKGISLSRHTESMLRHLCSFRECAHDEDHLVALFANVMMALHTREMIKRGLLPLSLDDLTVYPPQNEAVDQVAIDKQAEVNFKRGQAILREAGLL
jgi:hypothetical protein